MHGLTLKLKLLHRLYPKTATISPTMGTADEAHDPATAALADDPIEQDKDRSEYTTALGARRTAAPTCRKQLPRRTQGHCQNLQQLAAKDQQQPHMASLFPAPQQSPPEWETPLDRKFYTPRAQRQTPLTSSEKRPTKTCSLPEHNDG